MANKQGKAVVLSDGTGGRKGGRPSGLDQAVPDDRDLESAAEDMSGVEGSPKRGRPDSGADSARKRGSGSKHKDTTVPALDLGMMEHLLAQHAEKIMKAQRENLDGMMALFEQKTNARIDHIEGKTTEVDKRVQAVEDRMVQMQEQLSQALRNDKVSSGGGVDRRMTLIFGGWERDSRRTVILQQLDEALSQLGLRDHLDHAPFCTGPRRSTALCTFETRNGESDHATRKRMHAVVLGLANAKVPIPPTGRKLFATYSKTKGERAVAGHASWVKRTMTSFGQDFSEGLDIEYNSGTCWMGASLISSATRPIPPGCDNSGIIADEVEGYKMWIDTRAIAKESKIPAKDIAEAFEEHRR